MTFTQKQMKMKGTLFTISLLTLLFCVSCKNDNAPEPSVSEQIEGQWEISPIFMEVMTNSILENASNEEKPLLEIIFKGGSVALHFKADHHLLVGYRSDALAEAGGMDEGEYLDITSLSSDSLQPELQWQLSSNNDSIFLTAQTNVDATGNDNPLEEERIAVAIHTLNETQLILLADDLVSTENLPMQIPFFRSAVPLYFLDAKSIAGDEIQLDKIPFGIPPLTKVSH